MLRPVKHHNFTVIEGGAHPPSGWLDFPSSVIARSPSNREQPKRYRVNVEDARKAVANGRRQTALDLWSVVIGDIPPVNNSQKWDGIRNKLAGIADATACFRGIRRPNGVDGTGWDYIAFVVPARQHFIYQPAMSC